MQRYNGEVKYLKEEKWSESETLTISTEDGN